MYIIYRGNNVQVLGSKSSPELFALNQGIIPNKVSQVIEKLKKDFIRLSLENNKNNVQQFLQKTIEEFFEGEVPAALAREPAIDGHVVTTPSFPMAQLKPKMTNIEYRPTLSGTLILEPNRQSVDPWAAKTVLNALANEFIMAESRESAALRMARESGIPEPPDSDSWWSTLQPEYQKTDVKNIITLRVPKDWNVPKEKVEEYFSVLFGVGVRSGINKWFMLKERRGGAITPRGDDVLTDMSVNVDEDPLSPNNYIVSFGISKTDSSEAVSASNHMWIYLAALEDLFAYMRGAPDDRHPLDIPRLERDLVQSTVLEAYFQAIGQSEYHHMDFFGPDTGLTQKEYTQYMLTLAKSRVAFKQALQMRWIVGDGKQMLSCQSIC